MERGTKAIQDRKHALLSQRRAASDGPLSTSAPPLPQKARAFAPDRHARARPRERQHCSSTTSCQLRPGHCTKGPCLSTASA
jgi:hypothetical protein